MDIRSRSDKAGSSADAICLLDRPGHAIRLVPKGVTYILHSDGDSLRLPPSSSMMPYETQSVALPIRDVLIKDAMMAGMEYAGSRQSLKSHFTNLSAPKCSRTRGRFLS